MCFENVANTQSFALNMRDKLDVLHSVINLCFSLYVPSKVIQSKYLRIQSNGKKGKHNS